MESFAFLDRINSSKPQPVYVVYGDEEFLRRQVIVALRRLVLGDDPDSMGLSTHPGDTAVYADVHDELETLPFLSPRRLVIIENADPFVTQSRAALEKYLTKPSATGT